MSVGDGDEFDISRITEYITIHISQKRFFENQPYSDKKFNVFSLSENHKVEDALVTKVLNLRFQFLNFTQVETLTPDEDEYPTIFIKWDGPALDLFGYPAEFLNRCCVIEMIEGVASIPFVDAGGRRTIPPSGNKRDIPVNGVNVSIFPLYIVKKWKPLPDFTNDTNELSLYWLSDWLGGITNMNLLLDLPDHMSLNEEVRERAEKVEYDDPNAPVEYPSQAQHMSQEDRIDLDNIQTQSTSEQTPESSSSSSSEESLSGEDWLAEYQKPPVGKQTPSSFFNRTVPAPSPTNSSFTTPNKPTVPRNDQPFRRASKHLYIDVPRKNVDLRKLLLLDEDEEKPVDSGSNPDIISKPPPKEDSDDDSSDFNLKFQRIEDFL